MSKFLGRGAGLMACSALLCFPHDPITTKLTWTQEVSRIVYKRCAGCHRPGGAAMSLLTYEEARPWAKAIRDEVLARRMPPWGAVKGIGDFTGDPSLSTPEIEMLIAWVEGGAPEGDPVYLPHRIPASAPNDVPLPRYSRTVAVSHEATLRQAGKLIAVRPNNLLDRESLEAWAVLPDGSVDRLIWLHDYRKVWTREYVLRDPLTLPAGSRLRVESAPNASLALYFQ